MSPGTRDVSNCTMGPIPIAPIILNVVCLNIELSHFFLLSWTRDHDYLPGRQPNSDCAVCTPRISHFFTIVSILSISVCWRSETRGHRGSPLSLSCRGTLPLLSLTSSSILRYLYSRLFVSYFQVRRIVTFGTCDVLDFDDACLVGDHRCFVVG